MAKFVLDLNKFKSAGVYTIEFDTSERVLVNTDVVRLVVGFSKKGPFNSPVFLKDVSTAKKVFGEIDEQLEKKGSYFHRTLETCLSVGPVFALNLIPFNDKPLYLGGDGAEYKSFSLSTSEKNGVQRKELVSSYFDKQRFWFPSTVNFNALVNSNSLNKGYILNLVNLSQTPMSFILRKPIGLKGFSVKASEWYVGSTIPPFIDPDDFMEDYFVEIIAVQGDFTDYGTLSQDPIFSKYFDKNGLIHSKIEEFLNNENVVLVGRWIGSIIPDFVDKKGTNLFIERIVNNFFAQTGIFCSVNREYLDDYDNAIHKVDLIGHSLLTSNQTDIEMLSYVQSLTKAIEYDYSPFVSNKYVDVSSLLSSDPLQNQKSTYLSLNNYFYVISSESALHPEAGFFYNVLVIPKPPITGAGSFSLADYEFIKNNLKNYSLILTNFGNNASSFGQRNWVKVVDVIEDNVGLKIIVSNPLKSNTSISGISEITNSNPLVSILSNDKIQFSNTLTISPKSIIYIKAPGFAKYFEVKSLFTTTNSNDTIQIESSSSNLSTTYPTFANKFCDVTLTDLQTMISNGTILISDVKIFVWDNPTTFKNLVPFLDTNNDKIKIVFEPDLVIYDSSNDFYEVFPGSKIYKDWESNKIVDGDYSFTNVSPLTKEYWKFTKTNFYIDPTTNAFFGFDSLKLTLFTDPELNTASTTSFPITFYDSSGNSKPSGDILFYSSVGNDISELVGVSNINGTQTKFEISSADASKIEVGYFIENDELPTPKLTRVVKKVKKIDPITANVKYEIETSEAVKIYSGTPNKVKVFKPLNVFATRLKLFKQDGFRITNYHLPDGTDLQLQKILSLIENTKIGETLIDKNIIDYRYIVDTFDTPIAPQMGAKTILSRLAMKKQKCLAILNAPSIKNFKTSTDPMFTDLPDPLNGNPNPILNTSYIVQGGNLSVGPSFTFSLPDFENGASHCAVYSPFLVYRDGFKNSLVPPAADVSNNYVRKFLNGNPYKAVAGPKIGVLSNPKLVGLEYSFTNSDRDNLEPFGINPIVFLKNIGFMIFGNKTAYQKVNSALNSANVRDILITIESGIEDILFNYLFEVNNATTRLEIKSIVESFLEKIKSAGALYDYIVIMDETNNTPEIIDQNFAVIDVAVEPSRTAEKFINRITILKTGTISSGGFSVA